MATTISTQDLIDVKRDIDDIGKAVNEKVIVSPRYGAPFKSLPMISAEFQISSDAAEAAAVSAAESASSAENSANNASSSANIAEAAATSATISANVFSTPAAGVDPVSGVADGEYYNVRSPSSDSYIDEYQNVGGVATPTGKSYPSSGFVNALKTHNNLDGRDAVGAHPASAISYKDGSVADFLDLSAIVKTILELTAVQNPKAGQIAHVLGYHSATNFALAKPYQGGGQFVFNAGLEKSKHNGGTIVDPNRPFPTDWSNQDQVQTWFTPVETGSGVWVRVSSDEYTIKVDDFGARGDGIHDDRIPMQASYDFLNSVGGGTVYYSAKNTYLVNSYLYKYFQGELLQLYSNISHISDGATIKAGSYFDDKIFVLFNGFDNATPELSSLIYNVKFDGLTFDFSGDVSRMRTSYKRRVGIQTGRVIGGYVRNCKFKNGDLQNAIIAGWGDTGDSFYVHDNAYVDLVQESPENVDYTAVYLCAKNSYVTDCAFLESSVRAYEIGCAVELHGSNSRFTNSFVGGLTKGCFLVATPTENTIVTDLKVSGIVGFVANSLTSPWSGDGCILARLDISNNYMRSYQLAGTSIDVHGYRGLVTTYASFGSGLYADIWVKNNVCLIENSANPNTATAVYSTAKMDRLVVDGNELVNCHDGVVLLAADQDWSGLKVARNNFSGINPSTLLRLVGDNLDNIVVYGNTANYFGTFDTPISITSNTITNSSVQETVFTEARPQTREFSYPIDFINAPSNKATFKLYTSQLNTPALAAGGVGAATVNVPADCIKAGCSYEFIGTVPSQIVLSSKTLASTNPVAFMALNKESYSIGADSRTGSVRVSIN